VLDMSKGFRAMGFAQAARPVLAQPGRHYTALVPTQLSRLVVGEGPGLEALRQFDGVLIGGAATPPKLLQQARALGVQVVTTYGMSETAGGCVYDGEPLRGVRVRTDDVIEISGPVLALGYRGSAEPFGEWFRTGDLGRLRDGRLEVLGRADDVIVTGGEKVPPVLVERALATVAGVLEACVVGVPDDEWGQAVVAVLVLGRAPGAPAAGTDLADGGGALLARLRSAVGRRLGAPAAPRRVYVTAALPTRGPGKVDRLAVRDAVVQAERKGAREPVRP
jgi:O-succinylbenzoic acid--CoA ligase